MATGCTEDSNYYKRKFENITTTGEQYKKLKSIYMQVMENNFELIINKVVNNNCKVTEVDGVRTTIIEGLDSINWNNEILKRLNIKTLEMIKTETVDVSKIVIE